MTHTRSVVRLAIWPLVYVLMLSGCYRTITNTRAPRSGLDGESTGVSWFGVTPVTHSASECPDGIAKIDSQMPVWGGLVYILTLGIVAPMNVEYQCAGRAPASSLPYDITGGDK